MAGITNYCCPLSSSNFSLPDIITVRVPADESGEGSASRDLVVEIENQAIIKPFVGGYVDKITSKINSSTCFHFGFPSLSCFFFFFCHLPISFDYYICKLTS